MSMFTVIIFVLGIWKVFYSFCSRLSLFFFFNDTATTEIYTFPYTTLFRSRLPGRGLLLRLHEDVRDRSRRRGGRLDRKSTRLNSSHMSISYAVFCLKKKKKKNNNNIHKT